MLADKKKPGTRELWTDEDYCQLLLLSYQGADRKNLQSRLSRSTAKIFSKLQKHILLTQNVISGLQGTQIEFGSDRVSIQQLEQNCPGSFKNIQRYLIVMKTLAVYVKTRKMALALRQPVVRMIPDFLYTSSEDVNQLTMRLSQTGLSEEEIRQIKECTTREKEIHCRKRNTPQSSQQSSHSHYQSDFSSQGRESKNGDSAEQKMEANVSQRREAKYKRKRAHLQQDCSQVEYQKSLFRSKSQRCDSESKARIVAEDEVSCSSVESEHMPKKVTDFA